MVTTVVSTGRWSVRVPGSEHPVLVGLDRAGHPDAPSPGPADGPGEGHAAGGLAPRRRAEFLRGRRLVRATAARVIGVEATEVVIDGEPGARPVVAGGAAGVSVSHTDIYTAAAAWADGDVGIDVTEPGTADEALVRRCCHRRLAEVLALGAAARAVAFARVWAVQEACVKARGQGLAAAPWRIPVDPWAVEGRWEGVRWRVLESGDHRALALAITP